MTALHPGVTEATIVIRVAGRPAPQGSKSVGRIVKSRANGRIFAPLRDSNETTLKPWREAVRSEVQRFVEALPRYAEWDAPMCAIAAGPVSVSVTFTLPKPASAPKRRRIWPIKEGSGDLDKLLRALLDGITDGGLWRTDAQVVHFGDVWKLYVGDPGADATPGAVISVTPITEDL